MILNSAPDAAASPKVVGQGAFRFRVETGWPRLTEGLSWREVPGVACDAQDRVHLFCRGETPVMVFEPDGTLAKAWGSGTFARAHGLTIGPDGSRYYVDDLDHTVKKFDAGGDWVLTLGVSGKPSETGATSVDYRTIRQAGPPFHYPTNLAVGPDGDLFVADGYGNARVHRFSADGALKLSWGEPGTGPGQFHVPHGIAVDQRGRICVADRENDRLQWFSPEGEVLEIWDELARPSQMIFDAEGNVWVVELGYLAGRWPGTGEAEPGATGGRVSVFDPGGRLLSRWGGGAEPEAPGDFFAPHDLALDSKGDLYVVEVAWSAGGRRGMVSPQCHAVQKFIRL
ncbi:MAG: hypothetical protein FJ404_07620 [Verrucomicrobia bacterium]|nr:hypothetical protein [Verrucomicrobiota bacterium]